jgi:hypothetical protein
MVVRFWEEKEVVGGCKNQIHRDCHCQETSTRDTANKLSLEICAPIVVVLLEGGCGKWCVSVVFLPGQVIGNWYL